MRDFEAKSSPGLESRGPSRGQHRDSGTNADRSCIPAGGSEQHTATLRRLSTVRSGSAAPYVVQLQRQYGNRYVQMIVALARSKAAGALPPVAKKNTGDSSIIQRFSGSADFMRDYQITGGISGRGLIPMPITGLVNTAYILAGSTGEMTVNLECKAVGVTSGFIKGGMVFVSFSLEGQRIPYRCTPQGEITIETAAIVPGHTSYDSSSMNPVGSDIGVAIAASVDASTNPSFLMEQISFTAGGGGIQVSVSKGPVSVGGPTLGGGGSESTSVPIRFNFQVFGQRPAQPAPAPATSATATTGANASASATITGAVPARVTVPSPHSIYFAHEAQTEGDTGELVRWAHSLPQETQDAIRTGRLTTTVVGYASTTGTDRLNWAVYSRQRAQWVRSVLAPALGVTVEALHVGWEGSYTAPPEDQSHPGGVANPHERRADITFAETTPMTPTTATASGSASSSATAHAGH